MESDLPASQLFINGNRLIRFPHNMSSRSISKERKKDPFSSQNIKNKKSSWCSVCMVWLNLLQNSKDLSIQFFLSQSLLHTINILCYEIEEKRENSISSWKNPEFSWHLNSEKLFMQNNFLHVGMQILWRKNWEISYWYFIMFFSFKVAFSYIMMSRFSLKDIRMECLII
jgi:hypothetical protein